MKWYDAVYTSDTFFIIISVYERTVWPLMADNILHRYRILDTGTNNPNPPALPSAPDILTGWSQNIFVSPVDTD